MFIPYNQAVIGGAPSGDTSYGLYPIGGITTVTKISFRLGDFVHDSIFSVDKDLYMGK